MIEELRRKLKEKYEEFCKLFGPLNKSRNKSVILQDDMGFIICSSLEVKISHNTYVPADVLTKSNKAVSEVLQTENPVEALMWGLSIRGKVAIDEICTIVDKDEHEVIQELGDLIYYNPIISEWEESSKFLAGNVVRKLAECEVLCPQHECHEQIQRSINALREVIPEQIPWMLLADGSINLGERWINEDLYTKFARWLFDHSSVEVCYFSGVDSYKVDHKNRRWDSAAMSKGYYVYSKGGTSLYGDDLLAHALENTTPVMKYGNPPMVDNDATQLASDKIEEIRSKFTEWLHQLPEEDKQVLVDTYNRLYNCYRLREYDGSHLTLPDINLESLAKMGVNEIRPVQKNGVWRVVQECGGIIDWLVGLGKTLCMVVGAHEMKRMGIRNKPCILCLKANVADVVKTYRHAYPSARILAPSEQDFEKVNRKRLFHEMKNNDWDCVIMTHDQFGKIPQSDEIMREILQEEVDDLSRDLETLSEHYTISRTMRKGLETRKAGLVVKLKTIQNRIESGKDRDVNFDEMGIDHLFIDEAHKFKNLTFTTRHNRVAGLGNQEGSQKALNMLFAIRTLQKRFNSDLQATFLSGTPISNSLTEMYLLFKYLRPRELERQNIRNFDAWAAVFAKKTTDYEFSVTNQIIAKERFRHFIKVPELALFYNEIADCKTYADTQIDRPEMIEELVNIPPTDEQMEFTQRLISYAKSGDGNYIGRPELMPGGPGDSARMLIATNYAKKMSTDMRLIDSDLYEDCEGNKITVCCRKVAEFYRQFNEEKGVQLIFCDLGVPDNKLYEDEWGDKKKKWTVYQAIKDKLVETFEIPAEEIAFIHDYNERTRPTLFKQVREGIIRVLLGSTDKAGTGVNVQDRIVAIHDLDIPWKPAELEQRGGRGARQGNWLAKLSQNNKVYRYIYAVEKTLDTYKFTLLKNKQTFIAQMKKNELQVRSIDEGSFDEGTGMNFAEYVAILSGDNTLLEKAKIDKKLAVLENARTVHYREQHNNKYLLEHKTTRLNEVNEILETLIRDVELYEGQAQRDEGGNRLNPLIIPELEETLKALQLQRDEIKVAREALKEQKRIKREQLEAAKEERKRLKAEAREKGEKYVEPIVDEVEEVEEDVEISIPDKVEEDAVVIGKWLVNKFNTWLPIKGQYYEVLGSLYGFDCCIERKSNTTSEAIVGSNALYSNMLYVQHPDGGLKYTFNQGIMNRDNMKLASRNWLNAIDRCSHLKAQYAESSRELERDIRNLTAIDTKVYAKEEEILSLRQQSKDLDRQISENINGSKQKVEEMV